MTSTQIAAPPRTQILVWRLHATGLQRTFF